MIEITIEDGGQYQIARVSGEFGADDGLVIADELSEHVSGEGAALVLELSALAFINSSGLAALMNLATRARLSHGKLVLVNPSPFVRGIFNTTRLDTWFDICETTQEAARKFTQE